MKTIGIIFLALFAIVGGIGLSIALDLGGLLYQKETAGFRGQSEAERAIESGRSRIQLYNEFFALCSGIQAKEAQLDALRANTEMPSEKRGTAITATQIARQTLITDYNGKATRSYTAARFKDAKLPFRIPLKSYDNSNQRTTCAG